ncbi:MAG TPA: CusA/CzcA family heavy metal efflux RND transporter [Planctomycetota bacterium]|nr:CusA/CzcA family heavy metal efflux RND transporter [Planctomycetota bacterium]
MLKGIIGFSIKNRFIVFFMALLLVGLGAFSFTQLPIDAVPDITNVQVQVLTSAPALGPLEVEQFITFPVEQVMSGIPRMTEIRSVSRPGLSAITVVFEDGTDIYWARNLVKERLDEARETIPGGFGSPEMGPISTGLGEIYQFEVRGEGKDPMALRTILDWQVAYQLRTVQGVVEVNTWGGFLKTYEVQIRPDALREYKLALSDIFRALEENNSNSGGGYIVRAGEANYIRGEGLISSLEDVGNIVVETREDGTPIYIRNLGEVRFAPMIRQGAVTRDGRGEAVTGTVMMLMGENSRAVVDRVKVKIEEIRKGLPPGVTIDTFYDRTDLVRRTIRTVAVNLAEGGILVIVVLFILLGNLRGGLVVALAIPLSMTVAFMAMVQGKVSANLMSLGALDFGLIVDGAVVMIENCFRRLGRPEAQSRPRQDVIREACVEVARPVVFGVGIIAVVYLPIMTLTGIEGKMFRPMAFTVIFALLGSLVLSLTLMPALAASLLRTKPAKDDHGEHETFLIRWLKGLYRPLLSRAVRFPGILAGAAVIVFGVSIGFALRLGGEFLPKLEEGSLAIQAQRLPSVSLEQSIKDATLIEQVLKRFPEVTTVVSKTGRAEIATDPMGVDTSDVIVMLKPRDEWTSAKTKGELVERISAALEEEVRGVMFSYTQPIELRFNELIAGVRSDVGIKLYGDDLETLSVKAAEIARVVSKVRGAEDVKPDAIGGLPFLRVIIKRAEIARYGINAKEILDTIAAMGGRGAGTVFEGQRRFGLQVRFPAETRDDAEKIGAIRVRDPKGRLIPLAQLAEIVMEEGPNFISREKIRRKINVELNVRNRDLAGFVAEAKKAVEQEVKVPPGYEVEWGGQFKNLEQAGGRLLGVVPLALFIIFVLLYTTFNSVKPSLLIYLNVPMAATGGVFALALRGMNFSISAGVGFIALFGVAVLNGLVLVSYIRQLREQGTPVEQAVLEGGLTRMRPVLMTALVASLGFIPMALSTGDGAEVQRPLATVVIGGLVTSTLLTLLVIPAIYRWFDLGRKNPV